MELPGVRRVMCCVVRVLAETQCVIPVCLRLVCDLIIGDAYGRDVHSGGLLHVPQAQRHAHHPRVQPQALHGRGNPGKEHVENF